MDSVWSIHLFGGLRAVKGDIEVSRFPLRKVAALLSYLACLPGRDHPRELLIELLWPESDLDAGRNRFSVTLSSLRRMLEPPAGDPGGPVASGSVLYTDRFVVRLAADKVTSDVSEFQYRLKRAELTANAEEELQCLRDGLDLYSGPLLPGFYDEWALIERDRQAEAFLRALERLTGILDRREEHAEALELARRAVRIDPSREEAHRCLIRTYARIGQVPQALRQYQELERILKQDLDAAPSSITRELVDRIRRGTLDQNPVPKPDSRFNNGSASQPVSPAARTEPEAESPSAAPAQRAASSSNSDLSESLDDRDAGRRPDRNGAADRGDSRLPRPLTRFFGRTAERQRVNSLLRGGERLVTLTGPGGAGKTRLALEIAREVSHEVNRVVWVNLAELRGGALIPDHILEAMEVTRTVDQESLGRIAGVVRSQPHVLVLDNFEHLIEEGADFLHELLETCPTLQCVVTSRQRLNLPGEREVSVKPLQVPEGSTPEAVIACESVQLFVDRARAVNPEFEVTQENAAAVREVCVQLEGIPLAIELAASRAHVLTPEETVEQLGRRFEFLVSRQRGTEARHRTLTAAVEWSFRLLSPEAQRFFARLSVFRGGWTAEAAQAVCMEGLSGSALEFLALLRECSLVVSQQEPVPVGDAGSLKGSRTRFSMLETLRQFAASRLDEDDRTDTHRRHRDWCMQLVMDAMPKSHSSEIGGTLERLDRESGNFWVALDWSRHKDADPQVGMRFCGVMGWFWSIRGFSPLTRDFVLEILWRSDATPSMHRARALFTASYLDRSVGNGEGAWRWAEEALAICRQLNDEGGISMCTATMARLSFERGDYKRCRELHQETLDLKTRRGDEMGVAMSMVGLGRLAVLDGDLSTARDWFEKSRAFSERIDDRICVSSALNQLSLIERLEGNIEKSRSLAARSLAMQRATGYRHGMASSMLSLARCALAEGKWDEAQELLSEAFVIRSEFGHDASMAEMVQAVALLGVVSGNIATAGLLVAYAYAQHEAANSAVALLDRSETDRAAHLVRESVGAEEWASLSNHVSHWRTEDAVRQARDVLENMKGLAPEQSLPTHADELEPSKLPV